MCEYACDHIKYFLNYIISNLSNEEIGRVCLYIFTLQYMFLEIVKAYRVT